MTSTQTVEEDGVRRRDWIHIAAISFAGVGGGFAVIPLALQMGPSKDVRAASTTEMDISGIGEGQSVKGVFRGQPLFVKRLTAAEIVEAKADDSAGMPDPETLADRTNAENEAILVTLGVCTHLG
ncbi:MAG: ubiquinol-cytochrome c reductase iron-sulfur subunit N-terminal domain-containing protein, partial [Pseudomonadota bacterium]